MNYVFLVLKCGKQIYWKNSRYLSTPVPTENHLKCPCPQNPSRAFHWDRSAAVFLTARIGREFKSSLKKTGKKKNRLALKTLLKTKDQNYDAAMVFTQL